VGHQEVLGYITDEQARNRDGARGTIVFQYNRKGGNSDPISKGSRPPGGARRQGPAGSRKPGSRPPGGARRQGPAGSRKPVKEVSAMLKAIHAQEDLTEALKKAESVREKLVNMKVPKAAELVSESIHETLSYYAFPQEHWRRIRTNNPLERINREIRRRTKVVGCFPDGRSALMLVAARLRHIAGTKWGTKKYLDISLMSRQEIEMEHAAQSFSSTAEKEATATQ